MGFEIDPRHDTFRRLDQREVPRTVSSLLGDKDTILMHPPSKEISRRYAPISGIITRGYGQRVAIATDIDEAELKSHSLFIFGGPNENPIFRPMSSALPKGVAITEDSITIEGKVYDLRETLAIVTLRNPLNPEKSVCFIIGDLQGTDLTRTASRISHLTAKSFIIFNSSGGYEAGIFAGEKVLRHELK